MKTSLVFPDEVFHEAFNTLNENSKNIDGFDEEKDIFEYFSSDVQSIKLTGQKLKRFRFCSYHWAPNLRKLDLSHNRLSDFNEEMFMTLKDIEQLSLINTFDMDVDFNLDLLSNLRDLDKLELTLPASFDFSILSRLCNLTDLRLHSAATRDSNLPRTELNSDVLSTLLSLPSLTTLYSNGFKIDHFELNCRKLEELSLSDNEINHFDMTLETGVRNLTLNSNKIGHFAKASLANHKQLLSFTLSRNSIENVERLGELLISLLGNNHGEDIDGKSDTEDTKHIDAIQQTIRNLNLNHNQLSAVHSGIFDSLRQLTELDLSHNSIESIEANAFIRLSSLKRLQLNNCKLKSISNETFNGLVSLTFLDLSHNQIEAFYVETGSPQRPLTASKTRLTEDEVEMIKARMFVGMRVEELNLSHNQLSEFNLICFGNLECLKRLYLSNNKLRSFTNSHSRGHRFEINQLWFIRQQFGESRRRILSIFSSFGCASSSEQQSDIRFEWCDIQVEYRAFLSKNQQQQVHKDRTRILACSNKNECLGN